MIGLLLKDFTIIKKQFKIMMLVMIFYAIWGYVEKSSTMFGYMAVLLAFFIPLTTVGFDERAQWNKYALCMPVKKSYVAISKYILGFIGIAFGVTCYFILTVLINNTITLYNFKIGLAFLSAAMILLSLYLPVSFKFGSERARYVIIIIGIVPCILLFILDKTEGLIDRIKDSLQLLLNLSPVIALFLVIISCVLSVHIIERKEY